MIDQERIDLLKARQPLNFSEALEMMKFNLKVTRTVWPDRSVTIKRPSGANDGSSRDARFVMQDGNDIGLSTADILAEDWLIVE